MAFADSSVSYKGKADKFVFATGSEYSPTDMFVNFKGVMPGDTLTQQIEVRNDVKNDVKIKLYMRSLGANEGSEEFLKQMTLGVTAASCSQLPPMRLPSSPIGCASAPSIPAQRPLSM